MFAVQRQESIVQLLKQKGTVTVSELSQIFDVSGETLRKDLLLLEQQGVLVRTHGGAVSRQKGNFYHSLKTRKTMYVEEKRELAQSAARLVQEGDAISIDEGSTAAEFAKVVAEKFSSLVVVTYSLEVFNILSTNEKLQIMLCGGNYHRTENCFTGQYATNALRSLHVDKAFLSPAAISLQYGIMLHHPESPLLPLVDAMIDNATQAYFMAESGKFEQTAFYKLRDCSPDYIYVTDSKLPQETTALYEANGLRVIH